MTPRGCTADVVIVGAGIAGTAAATALARDGIDVVLIDRHADPPRLLRAEKVSAGSAARLRELGAFAALEPALTRIPPAVRVRRGRAVGRFGEEEYGGLYWEMVTALRAGLPGGVELRHGRARALRTGARVQEVDLGGGEVVRARLLVLACGATPALLRDIGVGRTVVSPNHSTSFAFDVVAPPGERLRHRSLTYVGERGSQVDYFTLFPVRDRTRANLFTFWHPGEARARRLRAGDAVAVLREALPRSFDVTGPWRVASGVLIGSVALFRLSGYRKPGFVLLGDAHCRVCPTTGLGMQRALTDVVVLRRHVRDWLAAGDVSATALGRYYDDGEKRRSDAVALADSFRRRRRWTEHSLASRLRLWKLLYAPERLNAAYARWVRGG